MPVDSVTFQWTLLASDLEKLRDVLLNGGVSASKDVGPFDAELDDLDDYAHAAYEPLLLVSGTVAIDFLGERILDHVRGTGHSGMIIDTRGQHLTIADHPGVERGALLVVGPLGTSRLDSPSAVVIAAAIRAQASTPCGNGQPGISPKA